MLREQLRINYKNNLKSDPDTRYPMAMFGIECGDGWLKIIEPLFDFINNWNRDHELEDQIHINQIKEKFGSLRFYVSSAPEELYKLIDKAERLSEETCEQCSSPGKLRSGGWLVTECDVCNEKYKKT
jgi:hypothetical protein